RHNRRKILGSYRQVRRRAAAGSSRLFSAGALAIRGFGLSRWLLAADAGFAMGFQSILALKPLSGAGFAEKGSYGSMFPLTVHQGMPSAYPKTDFLSCAYEAEPSNAPAFEHAVASAALAA